MKLKNKIRLLNELAKETSNPKEFIYACMALQNMSGGDLAKRMNMTSANFYVKMSQFESGSYSITIKTIIDISKGLDIPPAILNTIVANYNLNKYLDGIHKNNKGEITNKETGGDS